MPKSTKRFILSDESVNNDGFVVLTDGGQLEQFMRNPVMLWMHKRAESGKSDDVLPLGYWDDIEVADGQISAVPVFDDQDPFAMRIFNKVENGTIRMSSMGLTPLDMALMKGSDLKLRSGRNPSTGATITINQSLSDDADVPVVTKWLLREASIVDIGSNNNSVALYDKDYQPIQLAHAGEMVQLFSKTNPTKIDTMNIELKAVAAELQLADDAQPAAILAAVQKLKTDKATAEQKLADVQLAAVKKDIDIFLSDAVKAKKITEGMKGHYLKLSGAAGENFEAVKSLINELPEYVSLADKTKGSAAEGSELDNLVKLSFDELDKKGKLPRLKELSVDAFKAKFKEKFGTDYKDK